MSHEAEVIKICRALDPESLALWLSMGRSMVANAPLIEQPFPATQLRLVRSLDVSTLKGGINRSLEASTPDLIGQPIRRK